MLDSNTINQDEEIEKFLSGFSSPEEKITDDSESYKPIDEECPRNQDKGNKVKKKPFSDLKELSFVRLIDPIHIPSYLVEQLKDRLYTVDKFYQYQKMLCLLQTPEGPQLNDFNFLYAIVHDKLRQVKGFAWMAIDPLSNSLIIHNFSMDREYWNKGQAMDLISDKSKKIMKDLKLSRIVWITKNPRFCENRDFKRSKDVIMTYEG